MYLEKITQVILILALGTEEQPKWMHKHVFLPETVFVHS